MHWLHGVGVALAVVAATVPAILADPSVAHYVAQHPAVAVYLPVVTGIVSALVKTAKNRRGGSA